MRDKHPDVLLIILDTMRRDRLSTYGYGRETSPALSRFAADATVFERAVAPAQWTVPSHASIFTGLYAGAHGLTEAGGTLSGAHPTLAETLQVAGYHTQAFSNNPLVGLLDNGLTRGFDAFYNYSGASPNRPIDSGRGPLRRALSRGFRRFAHRVQNQFAQSDWLFRVSLNPLLVPLWTRYVNYKGHTEHSLTDALSAINTHRAGCNDQPLFTFVNLMGAHLPYRPPQDYVNRVAPGLQRDKAAYTFVRRFNADAARWAAPLDEPLADWEQRALADFYDAEVAYQDELLGNLLGGLRRSGALDETLVIIAADHGEAHGDHGYIGHSFVVYQELVHVPLIVRYPERFPVGARIATNVSTRRIFHTVLDTVGVPAPLDEADPNAQTADLTLARSVNGRPDPEGNIAYAEAFPPQTFLAVMRHRNPALIDELRLRHIRRGVYSGGRKLTTVGNDIDGLFDVVDDPTEVNSLAEAHPDEAAALLDQINAFSREVGRGRVGDGGFGEVDAEVVDHLRALGYIE
jgi:arylsulfatase A-like enzyme